MDREEHDYLTKLRHDLHMQPELLYDTQETAKRIVQELERAGVDEIITGMGRGVGVVAKVRGNLNGTGRSIGLRADMDALPILEETGASWASKTAGKMHACGHDGHVTMLLGAARALARHRQFAGEVTLIFQPAEEGGAGAQAMIDDGLFKRCPVEEVYGMHNMPQVAIGEYAIGQGSIMASIDQFRIVIKGFGGHAAFPHKTIDPLPVVSLLIQGLQNIISRQTDPCESAVLSVTSIRSAESYNVIPNEVVLQGTVRTLDKAVRANVEKSIETVVKGITQAFSTQYELEYEQLYPITINDAPRVENLAEAAIALVGDDKVAQDFKPMMGGEDFAFMLQEVSGAMIFVGNGDSMPLHNSKYDFNDEVIPWGVSLWESIVHNRCASQR